MSVKSDLRLVEFLEGLSGNLRTIAIESIHEVNDKESAQFYWSATHSRSNTVNSHVKMEKIDTPDTYGYKIIWDDSVIPGKKISYRDLAWILNYGNHAFVMGDGYLTRAKHRLKNRNKRIYTRFKKKEMELAAHIAVDPDTIEPY